MEGRFLHNKSLAIFISLLVTLISGWFMMRTYFSEATCGYFHASSVASLRRSIEQIELFRDKNGRLPPESRTNAEVLAFGTYRVLTDGSYELGNIAFDGPSVTYNENGRRWRCGL